MQDGTSRAFGGSFNSSVKEDDLFVLCAANQRSSKLAEEFGRFCVEINPDRIVSGLKGRAHPTSQLDYEQIVCGKVKYRCREKEPGPDWALPENLILIKPESFKWQDEYRIAIGRRNALTFQNVNLTLQQSRPLADVAQTNKKAKAIKANIGRLTDAKLYEL